MLAILVLLLITGIIVLASMDMTMGMRPTQNAERNPIQATRNVVKRMNWFQSPFNLGFWNFPVGKRFFGPKWCDVVDPESATGEPPSLNTDKIVLDANTPFFSIRFDKTFYCTEVAYKNGLWYSSHSFIREFIPDSGDNWLYWDENDVSYASSNNRTVELIIDKIPKEGETGE